MEWSDLRVFLAIARTGTLASASRTVGQTQPTMGRRLRALEQSLGATLFQRTREGFVLTGEGAAVLGHATRIEEEALAFERQLAGRESRRGAAGERELEGSLRLSSSDWFGTLLLAPLLAEFGARHPRVVLELLTDSRLHSLSRRESDIAFRIRPFDEPDVISRRLAHIPYALYAARDVPTPAIHRGAGARLITMNTAYERMPDAVWLRRVLPDADIALRSNSREVQARLCAQGAGLAVLPRPLGDATPGIRAIDLGESPPGRDTFVGYHRDLRRLRRLRAFIDLTVEAMDRRFERRG